MGDFAKHVTQGTCDCTQCVLTVCGALPDDWPAWKDVEFAGYMRVLMMRLIRREPPVSPGVRRRYGGAIPWFEILGGLALEFGGDDDATR